MSEADHHVLDGGPVKFIPTMTKPIQVKVSGKTVAFPSVCPHCLRPATVTIGIQSPEEMVGFYVFFSRWKHSTIQVPFCSEFGRRLRRASTACIATFYALFAVFIVSVGFIIALEITLKGWQAVLSVAGLIAITWIPSLLVQPGRYIKLLAVSPDSFEFSVRDTDYARMMERLNGINPPINDIPPKGKDDGQAFAA